MATPRRNGEDGEGGDYDKGATVWSGTKLRRGGPSPNPAKTRQIQRRFRSLFHQAAKEVGSGYVYICEWIAPTVIGSNIVQPSTPPMYGYSCYENTALCLYPSVATAAPKVYIADTSNSTLVRIEHESYLLPQGFSSSQERFHGDS